MSSSKTKKHSVQPVGPTLYIEPLEDTNIPRQNFPRHSSVARYRALALCAIAIHIPFLSLIITIGVLYLQECPVCPYIPVYLIASGTTRLLIVFIALIRNIILFRSNVNLEDMFDNDKHFVIIVINIYSQCFLTILELTILTIGAIFIYGTKPNYDPKSGAQYCHRTVYLVAFWEITILLALLCLSVFLTICLSCIFCIAASLFITKINSRVRHPPETS